VLGGEWYLALGALAVCSKEQGRGQWQELTREKERWMKWEQMWVESKGWKVLKGVSPRKYGKGQGREEWQGEHSLWENLGQPKL